MNETKIIDAVPEDAPLIAWAVMEAIGEGIINEWSKERTREDVCNVFSVLASRKDTQYSYLNTRIAVTPEGEKAGVCVSYNGRDIKRLRRPFFEEANRVLGWDMSDEEIESFPCETCGEEFYLDTVAILPEHRGKGIGSALIADAYEKARNAGLPLGLLVADDNPEARKLYESQGFKAVERRLFAGEEMTNMRITNEMGKTI